MVELSSKKYLNSWADVQILVHRHWHQTCLCNESALAAKNRKPWFEAMMVMMMMMMLLMVMVIMMLMMVVTMMTMVTIALQIRSRTSWNSHCRGGHWLLPSGVICYNEWCGRYISIIIPLIERKRGTWAVDKSDFSEPDQLWQYLPGRGLLLVKYTCAGCFVRLKFCIFCSICTIVFHSEFSNIPLTQGIMKIISIIMNIMSPASSSASH